MLTRMTTIVLLSLALLQAQEKPNTGACAFNEIVNRQGWEVPGVVGASETGHLKYKESGAPDVSVTVLTPKSPASTEIVVARGRDGRLTYHVQPIDIEELWRFESDGHTFAYRVKAVWVGVENNNRYPLGTATTLLFYDSTGSGKFDVMRYADSDMPFRLILPEWVKNTPK